MIRKREEIKSQWLRIMITIRLIIRLMIIVEMIKMVIRLINTDDKNNDSLVTKMMTSNENNDHYGMNSNENNTGNDTDDRIVSIIRTILGMTQMIG